MFAKKLHINFRITGRVCVCLLLLCMPFMASAQDEEEVIVDTIAAPSPPVSISVDEAQDANEVEYDDVKVSLRNVPDSVVTRLKAEEDFAYANDPDYWQKDKEEKKEEKKESEDNSRRVDWLGRFFASDVVHTIFYILLGVSFVLIIYRIIVVNNLYSRSYRRRAEEEAAQQTSEIDDNNLEHKIAAAMAQKDYRMAIRYMYLLSLRNLQEKGWIRYHAQGTNNEYIQQVHHYGVGNEFRFLTHVYEYVWYGEFALSEAQFGKLHQDFQHFLNLVRP